MSNIDIIMCSDSNQFIGMFALINSIIKNSKSLNRLVFHMLVKEGEKEQCEGIMKKHFPNSKYDVKEFKSEFLNKNIRVTHHKHNYVKRVSNIMNFSRFYLGEMYPELKKVIYLDADMIVQCDIVELYNKVKLRRHFFAAVKTESRGAWPGFVRTSPHLKGFRFNRATMFNAGMFVTDLDRWRVNKTQEKIEGWMRKHQQDKTVKGLFTYGTQPILNIVFFDKYEALGMEWNYFYLGHVPKMDRKKLRRQKILHWAGGMKPWRPDKGWYHEFWVKYRLKID